MLRRDDKSWCVGPITGYGWDSVCILGSLGCKSGVCRECDRLWCWLMRELEEFSEVMDRAKPFPVTLAFDQTSSKELAKTRTESVTFEMCKDRFDDCRATPIGQGLFKCQGRVVRPALCRNEGADPPLL